MIVNVYIDISVEVKTGKEEESPKSTRERESQRESEW